MKNVFRIFRRDIKRLVTVPAAWIIIIGLCVTPALYAWFNIVGFWDPYGNTKSIQVSVASSDTGASTELTGDINLGDQIIETLKTNDQIGWRFVSQQQAMEEVRSGSSYAAIVIPEDFSENLASIMSGDFKRPMLQYYVNEKLNAVAPKITDVGANTIDAQVNSTFVSTVSKVVASTIKTKLGEAGDGLQNAQNELSTTLQASQLKVSSTQESLGNMAKDVDASRSKISSAKASIGSAQELLNNASGTLSKSSQLLQEIAQKSTVFSSSAFSVLDKGSTLLSSASASTATSVGSFSNKALGVQGTIGGTLTSAQSIADSNEQIIKNITDIVNQSGLDESTKQSILTVQKELTEQNQQNKTLIAQLTSVNNDMGSSVTSLNSTVSSINTATQSATANGQALRTTLSQQTIPGLTSGLSSLATTGGQLAGDLTAQGSLITQSQKMLDQLDTVLKNTSTALSTAAGSLGDLNKDLGTVTTDVTALTTSAAWSKILDLTKIDSAKISTFMSAPTQLEQKTVFPVATYGSAMAPLFTNLSLWIGAFVLVVILKLEVDKEGIEGITTTQAYMGRWLLMAVFSIMQALIVCIGDLIIGVQTVSAVGFVLTGVIVALAYTSIIYALSKSLAHVGKGICVLLVMVQIPGASGLYPIEMMPDFFRALYPLLPFTYGIDAMRETIGGFYDGHYAQELGKLGIFVALAFIIGLAARKYLMNLNRMFADELDQTEVFVGEKAEVGEHSYRLSQIIHALVDKDEYKHDMLERATAFAGNYEKMRRGALIAGFVVPTILAVFSSFSSDKKALVLGLWVLWVLVIIGFLLTIEYIRSSIASQVSLGNMPESDIRHLVEEQYEKHRHNKWRAGKQSKGLDRQTQQAQQSQKEEAR